MPETIIPGVDAATAQRAAALRERAKAGPLSLADAAKLLDVPDAALMAQISLYELQRQPGAAAIVAGPDGIAVIKTGGGEDVTITVPPMLALVFLTALLGDPATTIAIAAPLPAAAGTKEVQ